MAIVFQQIIQNAHKSVAFVMYSLITKIICWKAIYIRLNLWTIWLGWLGWSSHDVTTRPHDITCKNFGPF